MTIVRTDAVTFGVSTDSPQAIDVNSDQPALKITQQGSGVALYIEDESGDSTPFIVGTNGIVTSGGMPPFTIGSAAHLSNWMAPSGYYPMAVGFAANSALGANIEFIKSRSTTWGSYGIVQSGDTLATLNFCADDGTDYNSIAASIRAGVDGVPGVNDTPGRILFNTTPSGSNTPTERMRITSNGNVLIGTGTSGASKLVVADDSIQLNTAKTPASATDTGTTGEICWDSNYVYVCVATDTWKRAALSTWP